MAVERDEWRGLRGGTRQPDAKEGTHLRDDEGEMREGSQLRSGTRGDEGEMHEGSRLRGGTHGDEGEMREGSRLRDGTRGCGP